MNDDHSLRVQVEGPPRRAGFILCGVALASTALVAVFLFQRPKVVPPAAPAVTTLSAATVPTAVERMEIPAPVTAAAPPVDDAPKKITHAETHAKTEAPAAKPPHAHAPSAKRPRPTVAPIVPTPTVAPPPAARPAPQPAATPAPPIESEVLPPLPEFPIPPPDPIAPAPPAIPPQALPAL